MEGSGRRMVGMVARNRPKERAEVEAGGEGAVVEATEEVDTETRGKMEVEMEAGEGEREAEGAATERTGNLISVLVPGNIAGITARIGILIGGRILILGVVGLLGGSGLIGCVGRNACVGRWVGGEAKGSEGRGRGRGGRGEVARYGLQVRDSCAGL